MTKKRIFSGVQPSGDLHLGNYLGAISQWVELQDKYESIFCVVDYHAITVKQDPEILRKKIIEIARIYLASGINPQKAIIFQQSDVRAHTELAWILNSTSARMSDLNKMTQFKDKAGNKVNNVSVGLFDYPVLQAADILLYDTEVVPVGEDQVQHIELARDLAKRFNYNYEDVFKLPEAKILKEGARIMALDDPTKKMSKSALSENSRINLLDDPKKAMKKIMKATTDAGSEIKYNPKEKAGISNLLMIYSLLSKKSIKDLEREYKDKMYGEFKKDLAGVVEEFLISFQEKYNSIKENEVKKILDDGARRANLIAEKTLIKIKKSIGVN